MEAGGYKIENPAFDHISEVEYNLGGLILFGGNKMTRLKTDDFYLSILSIANAVTLMLLLSCSNGNSALAKTPKSVQLSKLS